MDWILAPNSPISSGGPCTQVESLTPWICAGYRKVFLDLQPKSLNGHVILWVCPNAGKRTAAGQPRNGDYFWNRRIFSRTEKLENRICCIYVEDLRNSNEIKKLLVRLSNDEALEISKGSGCLMKLLLARPRKQTYFHHWWGVGFTKWKLSCDSVSAVFMLPLEDIRGESEMFVLRRSVREK